MPNGSKKSSASLGCNSGLGDNLKAILGKSCKRLQKNPPGGLRDTLITHALSLFLVAMIRLVKRPNARLDRLPYTDLLGVLQAMYFYWLEQGILAILAS